MSDPQYPNGKLNDDDKGALPVAFAADHENNVVILRFFDPITWIGLDPERAFGFAAMITSKALELLGHETHKPLDELTETEVRQELDQQFRLNFQQMMEIEALKGQLQDKENELASVRNRMQELARDN